MKKIVIITDRIRVAKKIAQDIEEVLLNNVVIETLTFEDANSLDIIKGDLLLFTLGNRIERVKDKLLTTDNILIVRRTIKEESFVKILEIPKNTDVLVVNDNYENTLQLVSLFYDLNIDNIILHPYKEDSADNSITVAITPGEADKVPSYIKHIVDIGDRCLDVSTLMEIISRLELNTPEIQRKLLEYVNQVAISNDGTQKYYKDAVIRNIQLEQVLKMCDQGVLMTLPNGEITLYNGKILQMVAPKEIVEGQTFVAELFDLEALEILNRDVLTDAVIHSGQRDIVVTKSQVTYESGNYRNLYFFRDVTYIKALEQTVSGQLKSKGFVARYHIEDIIHTSECMKETLESIEFFAKVDKTVLIMGESGTGKELLAQSIHNLSKRKKQPFVAINCGAVPASLLESELFGYEKGAFTGANKEGKAGFFERANNGTIFLDEIADMPYELQSRLLRVLQERQVMRVGGDRVVDIDVRIVSATNKDLLKEVEDGRFRGDLYYRLGILPITIPPLRDRKEDIMPIFKSFISSDIEIPIWVEEALVAYNWPGNIRQLRNVASYFELMAGRPNCLPEYLRSSAKDKITEISNRSILTSTSDDKALTEAEAFLLRLFFESGEGIGRGRIMVLLAQKGYKMSEYKLRSTIKELEDRGFIISNLGRGGTKLTEIGEKALNTYKQDEMG